MSERPDASEDPPSLPADDEEPPMDRGPRVSAPIRAMSLALLILIGACTGGAIVRWVIDLFQAAPDAPAEVLEVRPTPDVITAVRDLARLETASFHVERVVDVTSHQRRLFGLIEADDSILLVAASDVIAGVDLARLEDGDVEIEPDARRATVMLPAVEIFSARLDNDRTYVHRRHTDALAERRTHLETEARREAERTLRDAALEGGIVERAERNAAATVEALVRSLGYDEVIVGFRPGGPASEPPRPERATP